jgi:hypothetical protein
MDRIEEKLKEVPFAFCTLNLRNLIKHSADAAATTAAY